MNIEPAAWSLSPKDLITISAYTIGDGKLRLVNGRLKNFKALNATFRHSIEDKHQAVFEAIIVIIQYELDHGIAIFDP